MATGGTDGIIRVWDTETGQQLRQIGGVTERVRAVAFSTDVDELDCKRKNHTVVGTFCQANNFES